MAARLASTLSVLLAAALLAVLVLPAVLAPPAALADGDPASDTLLGENVFYPYTPPVAPSTQRTLNAVTAATKKAGFPVKVALIAAPTDLGVIPDLFGQPRKYADFLDQEISFQGKQPLLVVMAAGYGVQGMNALATSAARGLKPPAGKTSTDLAQAAITAVSKLAAAAGHPVKNVPGLGAGSGGGGGGSATPLVIGLAAAAVLVAGALVLLRRRQAPAS